MEGEIVSTGLLTVDGGDSTVRGLALNRQLGPAMLIESTGNTVEGNFIGTDISGTGEFDTSMQPNVDVGSRGFHGVRVSSTANTIGGTTAAARNLISANTGGPSSFIDNFGVSFVSSNNRLEGNLIGTDRTGMVALPNASGGVSAGNGNTISGSDPNAANVISGNTLGLLIGNGNLIQNNRVGTDPTGTLNVGNTAVGILSINSSNNQILENTVAFNGAAPPSSGLSGSTSAAGIRIGANAITSGNLVSRNSIFDNFGPDIDLDDDGYTPNDVPPASDPPDQDTGPNGLQNTPILTSATDTGGGTQIVGTLQSTPNSDFRIEFFASPDRNFDADPTGAFTGGRSFLGFIDIATDANGDAGFTTGVSALPAGMPYVTATATDISDTGSGPRNDTSEFSPAESLGGCSYTVTSTADSGPGTLRDSIVCANLTPGPQTIDFNIAADDLGHFYYQDDGIVDKVTFENTTVTSESDDSNILDIDPDWPHSWFGIILDSALPVITDTVTIDSYTQPGAMENTLSFDDHQGLNTVLKIELDGRNVDGDGFSLGTESSTVDAGGSVIRGFAINAFGGDGIQVNTLNGGNTIAGNLIGSDVSGTLNFGNLGNGILLVNDIGDVVGGAAIGARNLISGNARNEILAFAGERFEIRGNLFNGDRNLTRFFEGSGTSILFTDDSETVFESAVDGRAVASENSRRTPVIPHADSNGTF